MKPKNLRPQKIEHLLDIVKKCIEPGKYLSCLHLEQREEERGITRREVLYVLLNGFHEKKKTISMKYIKNGIMPYAAKPWMLVN